MSLHNVIDYLVAQNILVMELPLQNYLFNIKIFIRAN